LTRIIGIDPGTRITGYGVVDSEGTETRAVDFGCIKPPPKLLLSQRYRIIFEGIKEIIRKYEPQEMAVENVFFAKNASSALKLGQVRGVIILAGSSAGIPIFEYSPRRIKMALVGRGGAIKEQVQSMVGHLLNLDELPKPIDVADALATAICHAQALNNPRREESQV
jgi:crossover junction endodeoxyribonuclease RuvC